MASRTRSKVLGHDRKIAQEFSDLQSIVTEIRLITRALKVSGSTLYYTDVPFLTENSGTIAGLARLKAVAEVKDGTGVYLTSTQYSCWLDIDQSTAAAYAKELEAQAAKQEVIIVQLEARLSNKSYVDHAPHAVVEQTRQQLTEVKQLLTNITAEATRFGSK